MYTTNVLDEVTTYESINEGDAYRIAIQVLDEMQEETWRNPDLFKNRGFSELYNLLITKVIITGRCIKDARIKED